jgi:hypothetical protein
LGDTKQLLLRQQAQVKEELSLMIVEEVQKSVGERVVKEVKRVMDKGDVASGVEERVRKRLESEIQQQIRGALSQGGFGVRQSDNQIDEKIE